MFQSGVCWFEWSHGELSCRIPNSVILVLDTLSVSDTTKRDSAFYRVERKLPTPAHCAAACRSKSEFFTFVERTGACSCQFPTLGAFGCGTGKTTTVVGTNLYRITNQEFYLRKANACCLPDGGTNNNNNKQCTLSDSASTKWFQATEAKTIVECANQCRGLSLWFVFGMVDTVNSNGRFDDSQASCRCVLKTKTGATAPYVKAPYYIVSSNYHTTSDFMQLSLAACKAKCSGDAVCSKVGFSWHTGTQNDPSCRIPKSIANFALQHIPLGDRATIVNSAFYRVE